MQSLGAGCFVTINETRGNRRRKKDVTGLRAVFCEHDNPEGKSLDELLISFPIKPSFVNETSERHYHFYWPLIHVVPKTQETESRWYGIQRRLVESYGGDPSAHDAARVLRLADSLHQKRGKWRVRTVYNDKRRFTLDELADKFTPICGKAKGKVSVLFAVPSGPRELCALRP